MNKKYSIVVDYSPAYELVMSFYAYLLKNESKTYYLGDAWRRETQSMLPSAFASELEDERWEVLHRTVLLIAQCPARQSVEGFLNWLEQLPAGELYERLSPWVRSIPLNLGEIRDRTVYLLSNWHEHYFRTLDQAVLRHLEDEAKRRADLVESLPPIDLIEDATNGIRIEPVEGLKQVILVPQYHCAPATVLDFFRGVATCLYPTRPPGRGMPYETLLRFGQCLADENRLRILRLLAEQPRTLAEIHQSVSLAKSTVHHHLTALRRAGMIRSHFFGDTTPAYYSARVGIVDELYGYLKTLLEKEG